MSPFELLERLTTTPGIPGREHRIRALILKEIEEIFDEISVDPLGSIIARRSQNENLNPKHCVKQRLDDKHSRGNSRVLF